MKKRSYKQNCALAHAADIVTERWTLLIVRELLLRPCRYNQLLANLKGMGTNLLASRLKEMGENGLIAQENHHYRLTELGLGLEPIVLGLINWGFAFSETHSRPDNLHRHEWDLLAMKALFRGLDAKYGAKCLEIDLSDNTDSNYKAWIRIEGNTFDFGFGKVPGKVDIHWRQPLAKLRDDNPGQYLVVQHEIESLNQFIGGFRVLS